MLDPKAREDLFELVKRVQQEKYYNYFYYT